MPKKFFKDINVIKAQTEETKQQRRAIVWLSLAFCFMIFLYGPLEVFLTNSTEFWFDFLQLIPIVLVCFIVGFLLLTGANYGLQGILHNKKNGYIAVYTVEFVLFLGFYIQGNYMPRNYGVLDGTDINWESFSGYAVASIILWGVIITIGVVCWLTVRKYILKIGMFAGMTVIVMLAVALISLFPQATQLVNSERIVVTDKDQFTLSENRNIIMLCLDAFDANYLRALLEEDEKTYSDMLEDFTFYTNAIGASPTTRGTLPVILTQQWYENDIPYADYVAKAYDECSLYDEFVENNYSVGVYTDASFLSTDAKAYVNVYSSRYKINNYRGFISNLYKLVAFKYVPHQLKQFYTVNTGDFDDYKKLSDNTIFPGVSARSASDEKFYKTLNEVGFELKQESENAFRYIHLNGMHPPYKFGEDVVVDGKEYTHLDTAKGNMNQIKALIDELKEIGVYDDTAIVIMADHGGGSLASPMSCNPLLLVKKFEESHSFDISHAAISWEDIVPTIEALVTGEDRENAVWNIMDENRIRRYMYYEWDDSWNEAYLPTITEYSIVGDISDDSAIITPTGKQFVPGMAKLGGEEGCVLPRIDENSLLAQEIPVIEIPVDDKNKVFNEAYITGLGQIEKRADGTKYAWSEGYYTYFKFKPEAEQTVPYKFTLSFDEIYNPEGLPISETSIMSIYATVNGKKTPFISLEENSISFNITVDALQSDAIDVMIFYPYAQARKKNGENNALAITGIKLKSMLDEELTDETVIDFSENGNFANQVASGWNQQESIGIWSTDNSTVTFLSNNLTDIVLQMSYNRLTETILPDLYVNGKFVCEITDDNKDSMVIPRKYLNTAIQTIEIRVNGATSPRELGINEDPRTLGIYVNKIILTKGIHNNE